MATRAITGAVAAAFAVTLLGCGSEPKPTGYEPRADHRSDPLSPRDNDRIDEAILVIVYGCLSSPGDDDYRAVMSELGSAKAGAATLRAIAAEHPHAVFRDPLFGNDDTMIQLLERLAHEGDSCRYTKDLDELAERLRER